MTPDDETPSSAVEPATELVDTFVQTAKTLFVVGGVEATLRAVVELAVTSIEGCDFAGIFILQAGAVTTAVHTDPLVAQADARQLAVHQGPCLDAITLANLVYAEDLAADARWPRFGPAAAALGLRSLLALRLSASAVPGALNLYARYPSAFGAVDRARGVVLAGLAGLALAAAKARDDDLLQAENLRQALSTRELIGQAQGILMERERITAAQAFDILRRASQHMNVKLREVAQELIDTGEKPDSGPR